MTMQMLQQQQDSSQSDASNASEEENASAAHEETEEEFLERYAQTARDLQDEACEEAENGQHEDGHELALGNYASINQSNSSSFILLLRYEHLPKRHKHAHQNLALMKI